jgi:hypothetical protein
MAINGTRNMGTIFVHDVGKHLYPIKTQMNWNIHSIPSEKNLLRRLLTRLLEEAQFIMGDYAFFTRKRRGFK